MDDHSPELDAMADKGATIVLALLVGVVFLWVLSMFAGIAYEKLKPIIPFLVLAGFVGMLTLRWVGLG